ncbi:serine/threonine-protein kinase [Georgenia wangjunii]|uniref:serine/threonine-protein kinase n=1 Tax=Georgenia wangjunii TaxID=3117730 RepID=UPI002F26BEA4
MSPRRAQQPPVLPGYTFEKVLGSGGFADVYLYTQHLPQRKVAIKVLTHEATEGQSREDFVAEANLMAQLSTHSSIVTIYHADTAADGRPYLVMQFCPLPNLSERVRVRPLGVAEALGIGIRLSGAVETAHRAGIVHRDIKPANVLTTEYGRPALADFGIAGLTNAAAGDAGGVSVPWAPPESVEGHSAPGVTGDVYALAATIYTLLAGRSPFTRPGGPNSRLDYMMRIKRDPVPPIDREDVPVSLEQVLARAMAKSPGQRHSSALELARALQVVEQELRLPMTDIEVPDTSWMGGAAPAEEGASGRTVVRSVTEVDPHPRAAASPAEAPEDPRTVLRPVTEAGAPAGRQWEDDGDAGRTRGRARPAAPAEDAPPPGRPSLRILLASGVGVAVVVAVVLAAGALRGEEPDLGPSPSATGVETISVPDLVPSPEGLAGARVDPETVEFTWDEPTDMGDIAYAWARADGAALGESQPVGEPPLAIESAGRVCIELKIISEQGRVSAEPATACVD